VLPALLGLGETSNRRNPCEERAARMRFLTVAGWRRGGDERRGEHGRRGGDERRGVDRHGGRMRGGWRGGGATRAVAPRWRLPARSRLAARSVAGAVDAAEARRVGMNEGRNRRPEMKVAECG
jgi:hypothetical protein